MKEVKIIGAGLAGVEAAYYLLKKGVNVKMYEMRPKVSTNAHHTDLFAELVCSNSLKSKKLDNACGLLKAELLKMDSLCLKTAYDVSVPSGDALSVDRELFSKKITETIMNFPNFHFINEEVSTLDDSLTILATGPLTSDKLVKTLQTIIQVDNLYFYDASSPIISKDSIDFKKCYFASRQGQEDNSYLNCPFTKDEYYAFQKELVNAKTALKHAFDDNYFAGCQPIEIIAKSGPDSLRFGPLKSRGLSRGNVHPYAVAQLRQDNLVGDLYNLVGFQTNLTYSEQKRVFSLIPGLEHAEFVRYGLMHKNIYLNASKVMDHVGRLKNKKNILIAGQLSGVEGYVESMMSGLIMGINAFRMLNNLEPILPPLTTISGALLHYIYHYSGPRLEPMNANYGIYFNPHKLSKEEIAKKALGDIEEYFQKVND